MSLRFFSVSAVLALSLSACGGGGGSSTPTVAAADVTKSVDSGTVGAVTNKSFAFSAGVPAFGTTAPTTVAFTTASASPAFSITSGTGKATGVTTFGSCIFDVTESTFSAPHVLAADSPPITVHPCAIKLNTSGVAATGAAASVGAALVLGTLPSTPVEVTVQIAPGGAVVVNNVSLGTVSTAPVTGATGG